MPEHAAPHRVVVVDRERPKKGTDDDWDRLPESERKFPSGTMEVYAGMVERMNYNIGKIVDYLEKTGELDNTSCRIYE